MTPARLVRLRCLSGLLAALLACACAGETPLKPTSKASVAPSKPATVGATTGRVLDLTGKPAEGVLVKAYIISDNGGGIINNNGAGLVGKTKRQLLAEAISTRTDAQGTFKLEVEPGKLANVEAVKADDVKAIALGVEPAAGGLELKLAYTGSLAGRVTAPDAPEVTNFEGVDVYLPGTSYTAKADKAGNYEITGVPPGRFTLVAEKAGLGTARVGDVAVQSREQTSAPDLALSVKHPRVTTVSPANGGPGSAVKLSGDNFGASTGETLSVSFGGVQALAPKRVDDHTIEVTVPDGVTASGVTVAVGGVASEAAAFKLIKTLAFDLETSVIGQDAVANLTLQVRDEKGEAVAEPALTWKVLAGDALAVDDQGQLVPKGAGIVTLEASSGGLKASKDLLVLEAAPVVKRFTSLDVMFQAVAPGVKPKPPGPNGPGDAPLGLAPAKDGGVFVWFGPSRQVAELTPGGAAKLGGPAPGIELAARRPDGVGIGAKLSAGFEPTLDDYMVVDAAGKATPIRTASGLSLVDKSEGPVPLFGAIPACVAPDGTMYLANVEGTQIYSVTPAGVASLVAGDPAYGFADGAANKAKFAQIGALATAKDGTLYIFDLGNHRLRKLAGGQVSTVAGRDKRGRVDGKRETAGFLECFTLAVDDAGNVWVGESDGSEEREFRDAIRVVTPDGAIFTVAGGGTGRATEGPAREVDLFAVALSFAADGNLYFTGDDGVYQLKLAD